LANYRRAFVPGATWFFTVALAQRRDKRLLLDQVDVLRASFRCVREAHPFRIDAIVILPEHLHCIWTLPESEADFSTRWGLIKAGFSRSIPEGEGRSESRIERGERGIWQRRFWEHLIHDENDFERHVDYIHWNPVKHGHCGSPREWAHSSFHRFVRQGMLPADWGSMIDASGGEFGEPR
jgi:putative transposase